VLAAWIMVEDRWSIWVAVSRNILHFFLFGSDLVSNSEVRGRQYNDFVDEVQWLSTEDVVRLELLKGFENSERLLFSTLSVLVECSSRWYSLWFPAGPVSAISFEVYCRDRVLHGGVASSTLCIPAADWIEDFVANTFPMITDPTTCSDISYLLRKCISFIKNHTWR
jgi:hypothetical protein